MSLQDDITAWSVDIFHAADVAVVLLSLAGRQGFDLMDAARERHEFNGGRKVKR